MDRKSSRSSEQGIRLDVSEIAMIGREAELDTLNTAFHSINQHPVDDLAGIDGEDTTSSPTNCLFVSGESGCGKTKLVSAFRETVIYSGGSYALGKCDQHQYQHAQPCSAIWDALADVFDPRNLVLDCDIQEEISALLDDCDYQLLFHFVPSLKGRLKRKHQTDEPAAIDLPEDRVAPRYDLVRLTSAIRKLVRAITKFNTLVLILDDLQWCDDLSIDIVKSLLCDEKLSRFLFVGTYRTGDEKRTEKDATHLGSILTRVKTVAATSFETIELSEFSPKDINRLLSSILRLDYSLTRPLAELIHRKTAGNCFFVLQFLKLLDEKGLLFFSYCDYRWEWDVDRIQAETESASNVARLLERKLKMDLTSDVRTVLAVAACFGNKFVENIVEAILETLKEQDDTINDEIDGSISWKCSLRDLKAHVGVDGFGSDTKTVLNYLVRDGLIDAVPSLDGEAYISVYKFAHDRIQSAAYDLVKSADREMLHVQLAKLLYTKVLPGVTVDQRGALVVQIADLLDSAKDHVPLESQSFRLEVARLNLEAARIVRCNGAFLTAAGYLRHSVVLLGEAAWEMHYCLTLEICNLEAEMYFCCGKFLQCKQIVSSILSNATCIEDKLDAYVVLTDCLGTQKKTDEVLGNTYAVVSQLGYSTPNRMASTCRVFHQFHKAKQATKKYSDEELLAYKKCDDRAVEGCLKLLSRTAGIAWMADETNNVAFIGLLMCNISLERGFNKYSANSIVVFSMVLTKMGNCERGKRFGKLALDLSDRFKAIECDGITMLWYYAFIHHMSKPMHSMLNPLIEANRRGKAGGDVENSHHACSLYIFTYIICGLPLMVIENDAREFICEMKEYKRSAALTHSRLSRQLALNLIHPSDDPYKLEGTEIKNLRALLMQNNECENRRTRHGMMNCRLYLACYLGCGREGRRTVVQHAKLKDPEYPISYSTVFPYLRGMICFRLLRTEPKNKRRFWKQRAMKEIRRVKTFVRRGFVNCCHQLMILEAELLAFQGRSTSARIKAAYDKAIALAMRSGFPQDAGLASEYASRHFRKENEEWATICLKRAHENFQQWGALAKLERINSFEDSGPLCGSVHGTSTVSSAIHGRSRRDSFYRKSEHQSSNWFLNSSNGSARTRQNLSMNLTSSFVSR